MEVTHRFIQRNESIWDFALNEPSHIGLQSIQPKSDVTKRGYQLDFAIH